MQDQQEKALETFRSIIPKMTLLEQEKLISFGEGLTFLLQDRAVQPVPPPQGVEHPSA